MWLKLINLLLWNSIVLITLNLQQYDSHVEAVNRHSKPLGSWFGSLEQIDLQDTRSISTPSDQTETSTQYKKRHKKKRFKKKEKGPRASDEVKPKKKRKKKEERKFVKTVVRERDGEYNASSSIENSGYRKPVDIIIHIKMHE